jgi:LysR family glycine cleavage system transcriptional activator
MSLVRPHVASGRLIAPFPEAMPTSDRLTLASATAAGAHPRRVGIMEWLAGGAAQI